MKNRSIALLFAGGVLLGQLAWISAIPPYRGIDEFDHVYRAASVAEGYWGPGVGAPQDGRGDLVPVPPEIVTAGSEVCESYEYTGRDNCRPVMKWDDELVTVASAASRYNPGFYWLIGKPAQFAEGAHAVYVMRLIASLACALLVGLAAWATSLWSRTRWPLTALALALTPVAVYSTAMPAPNGIEMAGALCVWCGLLGFSRDLDLRTTRALIAVATLGAIPLVLVRSLGPLLSGLALIAVLVTMSHGPFLQVLRRVPRGSATALLLVGLSAAASAWWTASSRTNALEQMDTEGINRWLATFRSVPLWFLQSIAAFPTLSERAPTLVYASSATAFAVFVTWAAALADRRVRTGLAMTAFLSLAVPFAVTLATVMTAGVVWQGRYTLPFSFGVVLIAGLALERARATSRLATAMVTIFGLTTAISHTVSVVNVQHAESLGSPLAGDPRWISAPLGVVGALATLGVTCWVVAILRSGPATPETAPSLPGAESVDEHSTLK